MHQWRHTIVLRSLLGVLRYGSHISFFVGLIIDLVQTFEYDLSLPQKLLVRMVELMESFEVYTLSLVQFTHSVVI